ncbi:kinase binding protein CGI-121-domain-containing protein [Cladorrhinum samala]|uniref:EKC/KEOPS complex subunit CGI121 n=1 Tax=Cladorrhinum samala TaxID=585594 RepID=A0AAV9HAW2_9PEZI|nr:kinase binding protein CGI-121-domain-containing protein [Cladorrhinum samala]
MALERLTLEHVPSTHRVYITLFRDVSNSSFLQSQLISRNPEFEYAFIDVSSIISRTHLLAAVYNAINTQIDGTLKTPNVHSEVVISLSPSNNIAETYRRWGITPDKTKDLIVVKIVVSADEEEAETERKVWEHLTQHVQGTPVPLTDGEISKATDWPKVRKYYKLNGVPGLERLKDEDLKKKQMEKLVLMGMALRGM